MSTDNEKSSPVPTRHEKDKKETNQSDEANRPGAKVKPLTLIVIGIIVLIIILVFAGFFPF